MESIITNQVQEEQFELCLEQYKQKIDLCRIQAEEISERVNKQFLNGNGSGKELTDQEVNRKIERAIEMLKDLWNEDQGREHCQGLKGLRSQNHQKNNQNDYELDFDLDEES